MPILLFLLAMLAPMAHAQYLEPEDVLLRDRNALYVPTSPRAAQQNAADQEAQRAALPRPTVQDPSTAATASSSAAGTDLHNSPPLTTDPQADDSGLDPVTLRWLRRLQENQHAGPVLPSEQPTSAETEALLEQIRHSTALHSGADLAGSGPAETATVGVMGLAIAWTILRARRLRLLRQR